MLMERQFLPFTFVVMQRVLITDYVHPLLPAGLRTRGYHVNYAPEIMRQQVLEWIPGCSGIVINTKTVADAELIAAAAGLKWIARLGSGLDIIDLKAAEDRNIVVINTPRANANAVAEHVMGMLLALLRHIPGADHEIRRGLWFRERNRGVELSGKTIGIIGFGNTGSAFAAKFAGWNVRILSYDKYKSGYAEHLDYVQETDLDQVMRESDIISLHLPLTDETRQMVNETFLAGCRKGCILINSSRGRIINTAALVFSLATGHIGGACLDVLENEHPDTYTSEEQELFSVLSASPNVVLTPHIAGWTVESKRQISEGVLMALDRM